MLQISRVLRINHLPVATWFAKMRMRLEECAVSAFQQVALGVVERWIAIAMTVAVLVTQKPHSGKSNKIYAIGVPHANNGQKMKKGASN
jgi:hypothetical protein